MATPASDKPGNMLGERFRIGALSGASTAAVQAVLARFAGRRRGEGLRVAGAIEESAPVDSDSMCGALVLRDLTSGQIVSITQNLGPGSASCRLDSAGLAAACHSIQTAIERGADLVVLSKFGKIEAEGGGLLDAFRAAAEAGLPCVTGVASSFAAPFLNYAGAFSQWIEASDAALERWWSSRFEDTPSPTAAARRR